jgi:hypothetical protein
MSKPFDPIICFLEKLFFSIFESFFCQPLFSFGWEKPFWAVLRCFKLLVWVFKVLVGGSRAVMSLVSSFRSKWCAQHVCYLFLNKIMSCLPHLTLFSPADVDGRDAHVFDWLRFHFWRRWGRPLYCQKKGLAWRSYKFLYSFQVFRRECGTVGFVCTKAATQCTLWLYNNLRLL